ncbi:MmgE/PrpD family protein [Chachezhania sediminis]|uniref:MmgE/PrpD family protein n=1 Tax=Chachezhania sediminis TaxID=2599291 RepID=UPI00131AB7F7|nr:MmgE/PrpD family protein [Chachezhania sediminis]
MDPISLIHRLRWEDLPADVRARAPLALLDLIGVAAGGLGTDMSRIARDHAAAVFGGTRPILFDGRTASAPGVALAAGITIDALDAHDGYNPSKGHIGCPLISGILAIAPDGLSGAEALATLVMGYEFGARAAEAQHGTVPDYHTTGSWGAVVAAAAGSRLVGLDDAHTREALGIAEYHGPRSQMMRCVDEPTMVKDGPGWGAMAGISAVLLAQNGFTGAPAITVEQAPEYWTGIGSDWRIFRQYFKPYPVCRWAQAPVEGVLALKRAHGLTSEQVARIRVETFHESVRLATRRPVTTEQAQYSTSFPCAVALVRDGIGAADVMGDSLTDPEILRLSDGMIFTEDDAANAAFPLTRLARVTLELHDGTTLTGDWMQPRWDHDAPPTDAELRTKYHSLADPVLGQTRASAIEAAIDALPSTPFSALTDLLNNAPDSK